MNPDQQLLANFAMLAAAYAVGRFHQHRADRLKERQRIADIRDGLRERRVLHIHRSN